MGDYATLNARIDKLEEDGRDASVLKANRAQLLVERLGGLGAALEDCDSVLLSSSTHVEAKTKALGVRALILAFLGADKLASQDLKLLREGQPSVSQRVRDDIPAAFVCSAADWHRARRLAMLRRHPELRDMYSSVTDTAVTCVLMLVLVAASLCGAAFVGSRGSIAETLALASTLGAVCAYGFQALTHELGHMATCTKFPSSVAFLCAALGSSLTNFPWHYYYWRYHNRHHAHAGGERDRDGDILFHAWQQPPVLFRSLDLNATKAGRWLWTAVFAFGIYGMFCKAKYTLDSPHIPSVWYEGWNVLSHLLVFNLLGSHAALYLIVSAAFSLGAFGHPYLQFWLIQHAFVKKRTKVPGKLREYVRGSLIPLLQPTCSACMSSPVWHALNFGELRHVEHHDFPFIPYLRAFNVSAICPEFYQSLDGGLGAPQAIKEWIWAKRSDGAEWMETKGDFAGRKYFLSRLWCLMEQYQLALEESGEPELAAQVFEQEEDTEQGAWREEDDVDDEDRFVRCGRE